MPKTTLADDRVQGLLAAREIAILATVQPSGAPLAMAMWFVHDRDGLTMVSQAGTQKMRNLRRDPRASVAVESVGAEGERCVSIQGTVAFVEDPAVRAPFLDAFFARYGDRLAAIWSGREMPPDRVMFRLSPEKLFLLG